ncbi:MAG: 30S ribosomal protein S8 [Dehalococcoidia bacterium]|nr:30S ribosomal protein S8 [Dehalococcoidia bacterium]
MPVNDPIADMLTRIRNAVQVKHETVDIPASKVKAPLLKILKGEGFISGYEETTLDGRAAFKVTLKYYADRESAIHGLKRVSKPGLRVYIGKGEVPRYFGGIGVAFVSTPKGILTGSEARRQGTGGELLFYIW